MAIRVLVQAGHIAPREPGFEGGTGAIREQELTKAVRRRLVALLAADSRFEPVPCPGDIPDGVDVDVALFLHGDGAEDKAATGYSFGFPIHPVNEKLAKMIDEEFQQIARRPPHHEDNYTGGLREYYGYRRVPTAGPEVLVEHGFLTNPRERRWMFRNLSRLANAEYRALCRFFGLAPLATTTAQGAVGFTVIGEKDGEMRVLRRAVELSRVVDKVQDMGARLITIRKNRIPIQPARGDSRPEI
jgi:N-acetylmuramoyl-L-alanine amidase